MFNIARYALAILFFSFSLQACGDVDRTKQGAEVYFYGDSQLDLDVFSSMIDSTIGAAKAAGWDHLEKLVNGTSIYLYSNPDKVHEICWGNYPGCTIDTSEIVLLVSEMDACRTSIEHELLHLWLWNQTEDPQFAHEDHATWAWDGDESIEAKAIDHIRANECKFTTQAGVGPTGD